jgi:hypothetical protein
MRLLLLLCALLLLGGQVWHWNSTDICSTLGGNQPSLLVYKQEFMTQDDLKVGHFHCCCGTRTLASKRIPYAVPTST